MPERLASHSTPSPHLNPPTHPPLSSQLSTTPNAKEAIAHTFILFLDLCRLFFLLAYLISLISLHLPLSCASPLLHLHYSRQAVVVGRGTDGRSVDATGLDTIIVSWPGNATAKSSPPLFDFSPIFSFPQLYRPSPTLPQMTRRGSR